MSFLRYSCVSHLHHESRRLTCQVFRVEHGFVFGVRRFAWRCCGHTGPRVEAAAPFGGRHYHDPRGPECGLLFQASCRAGSASRAGMAAMLSAVNMRRPSSCQFSSCSSSTAPTSRVIEASFGKMPTTRARPFTLQMIWLVAEADRQVMTALLSAVTATESGCQQGCQQNKK